MFSEFLLKKNDRGFTLIETVQALMLFSLIALLALSTLFFFNTLKEKSGSQMSSDRAFEKAHLFFQKQIECSEKIYIFENTVYIQDMESPQYYDCYERNEENVLLRIKCDEDLNKIKNGAYSQFISGVSDFSLEALRNAKGELTGNIKMRICFNDGEKKEYKTVMAYPGGIHQMFCP